MFKLKNDNQKGKQLRDAVVDGFLETATNDQKVMALEADLGGASNFIRIKKAMPHNFLQIGIAEANMMGIAAGLSIVGYKPLVHTFAPFATRRAFDQIYLAGAYSHNTLNIYGSDPGFCAGPNGGTHTSFEDVAIMSTLPNVTICAGADYTQTKWITKEFLKHSGIHYLRANRKATYNIYSSDSTFELGKGNLLQTGKDILIITYGQMVKEALDASALLKKHNYDVSVIDMFCLKPLDKDLILKTSANKKLVVTFENHYIHGGLGSMVAELFAENNIAVKFKRLGIGEVFGQVGSQDYLQRTFKLTAFDLYKEILNLL